MERLSFITYHKILDNRIQIWKYKHSEIIEKILDIVINDWRVKVREIAGTVGISIEGGHFSNSFGYEKAFL